jgi:hypothetical protein
VVYVIFVMRAPLRPYMFGAPHFAPNVNLTSPPCKRRRQRLAGSGSIVLYCFVLFQVYSRALSRGASYIAPDCAVSRSSHDGRCPGRKFRKGLPMSGTAFGRPSRINSCRLVRCVPPNSRLGSVSGLFSCLYKLDEIVGQFHQILLDRWVRTASRNFQKSHRYPFQVLAVLRL